MTPDVRAVLVLVAGDRRVELGRVRAGARCDLGLVEALLRLALALGRRGWHLHLVDVDRDLRALLELVGVAERLGLDPQGSSMRGGRPSSANDSG